MHEMRGAPDLDVASHGRTRERIDEPARIAIGDEGIPLAANDLNRRWNASRIVGQAAMPGRHDIGERSRRNLHAARFSRAAFRVAAEIQLRPLVEVSGRENERFTGRDVLDEAIPLGLFADQLPCGQRRRRSVPWRCAIGAKRTSRFTRFGSRIAKRLVAIDPQECAMMCTRSIA